MAQIMTECGRGHNILSIDVHPDPDKPWILASHANGNVSIWNYQTRARESEFRVSHVTGTDVWGLTHWISCAKFIPGEECIVAGGGNGDIHVVMYTTEQEVKRFNAHKSSVESLAVHPNRPLVLSACMGKLIKLWNRNVEEDADWEWIRTFKGHDDYLKHVTFSPDGNTFASASQDCTVKIWNIEDRDPIATLDCGEDIQQHVAYFSTGDGRNYIIAGSLKGSARVWDWRANTCIQLDEGPYSEVYGCNVGVINFAPDHNSPVLITVSEDMSISLWDAATHKPRFDEFNDLDLNHGPPQDFVYIKSTRSLAIACSRGIAILDMTEAMNEDLIRRVTGRPKRVIRKPHWLLSADWDTSQD